MKNLGSLILGLIIGALIMYFYCCKATDGGPETIAPPPKPNGIITIAEAKALDANFTKYRVPAINTVKPEDNRSVWFSYSDMEKYLAYAKYECNELNYTMDGVRIYLGVYGNNAPKGSEGYTTVFMVPTGTQNLPGGASGFVAQKGGDIPGGPPLNMGQGGTPPSHNYPQ
ncbi:hypothetical protein [Lacinutrix salivirga]